jgi:hypothetical protein
MPSKADLATTLAGGGAGLALLLTVRWEAVPAGELVKVAVAMVLIVIGVRTYATPKG